jgi:hypothetical protein
MIQILTKEQAAERALYTHHPVTGEKIPFGSWRMELTEEQKEEHQRMLDAGEIEF